jgi:hypothetical protein
MVCSIAGWSVVGCAGVDLDNEDHRPTRRPGPTVEFR